MMMSNLEIEDALIAFGAMEAPAAAAPRPTPDPLCREDGCGGAMTNADHFPYCRRCGTMDTDAPLRHYQEADAPYVPKASLYKRRQYYLEKINTLLGRKQSRSPKYREMLAVLKTDLEPYDGRLEELRARMKRGGYHRFYRFLYNVHHDLTGERLVTLTDQQVDCLTQQFVALEWKFKGSSAHTRKNFLCYASTLHYLMKKNRIRGYRHLLLPHNHPSIVRTLKQIDV